MASLLWEGKDYAGRQGRRLPVQGRVVHVWAICGSSRTMKSQVRISDWEPNGSRYTRLGERFVAPHDQFLRQVLRI